MIETYLLEYLVAFKKYETLSAAAEHVHIAQPALSRSMKKLENTLGVSLFDRSRNKIQLNENGEFAVKYAERILALLQEMSTATAAYSHSRLLLHAGTCADGPFYYLKKQFEEHGNGIQLTHEIQSEDALIRGLMDGVYRMIFLTHPFSSKDYVCEEFCSERLFFYMPKTHPLLQPEGMFLSDLDGESFLLDANIGHWTDLLKKSMPNSRFFRQQSFDALGDVMQTSFLPAFATSITKDLKVPDPSRVFVPVLDEDAAVTYYCICTAETRKLLSHFFRFFPDQNTKLFSNSKGL